VTDKIWSCGVSDEILSMQYLKLSYDDVLLFLYRGTSRMANFAAYTENNRRLFLRNFRIQCIARKDLNNKNKELALYFRISHTKSILNVYV
jgi:hypothetical protein